MNQVNDRFAFEQGGHFFYPKEGETLNQNWIVENLNNAFSTWNGKLTELWGLVTTSPQTFKGGALWGVMQSLHNAMIGIQIQCESAYLHSLRFSARGILPAEHQIQSHPDALPGWKSYSDIL